MGFIPCLSMLNCTWEDSIVLDSPYEAHIVLDESLQEEEKRCRLVETGKAARPHRHTSNSSIGNSSRTEEGNRSADEGASDNDEEADDAFELPLWLMDGQSRQDDECSSSAFGDSSEDSGFPDDE